MSTVPLPDLTTLQNELLRTAFGFLLSADEPVSPDKLGAACGCSTAEVLRELDVLTAAGRVRRTGAGEVVGALGLTIEPTAHELLIGETRRYTWCALDAVGILAALRATGSVRSTSPHTGRPVDIGFRDGEPCSGDLSVGLFLACYQPGTKVVDNWCPLVNFFEDAESASHWAAQRGVTGEFVPLMAATQSAGERWRARLEIGRPRAQRSEARGQAAGTRRQQPDGSTD
jgi:Alkylmercury lyase/DprA winged helix domain